LAWRGVIDGSESKNMGLIRIGNEDPSWLMTSSSGRRRAVKGSIDIETYKEDGI
jgi:hypothetical protein